MQKNILMPLSIILAGALVGGVLLLSEGNGNPEGVASRPYRTDNPVGADVAQANLRKTNLEIKNMFCIGCRSSVVNSVMALPGVVQADADPGTDSGWVIYNPEQITKEQVVAAPIFQAYPAKILDDSAYAQATADRQKYSGGTKNGQTADIPPEIEQKLNLLAQKLQERGVSLESFFQKELDDAINGGYFDKANNLLDNFLSAYE